jgi:cytidylate kinase
VSEPPLVVAIDGPAGVGKSTVARLLARRLGIPYLDTGAMYRALALFLLDRGVDPDDRGAVAAVVDQARIELRGGSGGRVEVLLDGRPVEDRIRTAEVSAATSRAAVHPEVRARMVVLQRQLAESSGGVVEGRDIGTRVLPEAPFKFFLDAPAAVRARRRLADLRAAGSEAGEDDVARALAERDERDRERELAPLVPAAGAIVVDTASDPPERIVAAMLARIGRAPQRKR